MAHLNMTSFEKGLKLQYGPDQLADLAYSNHVLLGLLKKDERMFGRSKEVTVKSARNGGGSHTFSNARSNKSAPVLSCFVVTRTKDYILGSIDGETIEASKGDNAAFMDAVTFEVDDAVAAASNRLSIALFRDHSGAKAQVSVEPTENASTFEITLKQEEDVTSFDRNQVIVIYSAKTGGSIRTSDGSDDEWTISKVDRDNGILTVSGTYDGSGTIAADDYIFIDGDRGAAMYGLESWIPYTAPSASENFFGVDRSVDPTRLAGVRMDLSGKSIEEGLLDLSARLARESIGKASHAIINPIKYNELVKELGSKVMYCEEKAVLPSGKSASIGFKGIVIDCPSGQIKIFSDADCPYNRVWLLDMNTVYLGSAGQAIKFLGFDGNKMLRVNDEDAVEFRMGGYRNMYVTKPGANACGSFDGN